MKKKSGNQSNTLFPLILIGLGVLLIIGVGIWAIAGQNQAANPSAAPSANQNTGQDIPLPEVKRVTLADAKAAFDGKEAVIVDVRDSESYAVGHIPGAVNIPAALMANRAGELDPNAWIITYCT